MQQEQDPGLGETPQHGRATSAWQKTKDLGGILADLMRLGFAAAHWMVKNRAPVKRPHIARNSTEKKAKLPPPVTYTLLRAALYPFENSERITQISRSLIVQFMLPPEAKDTCDADVLNGEFWRALHEIKRDDGHTKYHPDGHKHESVAFLAHAWGATIRDLAQQTPQRSTAPHLFDTLADRYLTDFRSQELLGSLKGRAGYARGVAAVAQISELLSLDVQNTLNDQIESLCTHALNAADNWYQDIPDLLKQIHEGKHPLAPQKAGPSDSSNPPAP